MCLCVCVFVLSSRCGNNNAETKKGKKKCLSWQRSKNEKKENKDNIKIYIHMKNQTKKNKFTTTK